MLRRALFAILSLAFATAAIAGPKEDLHAAFTKFLAQTSFKGSIDSKMNNKPMHSTVEFQAPDRYRVTTDGRPSGIIIGPVLSPENVPSHEISSAASTHRVVVCL